MSALSPAEPLLTASTTTPAWAACTARPVRGRTEADCAFSLLLRRPFRVEHPNRASASAIGRLPGLWPRAASSSSHASHCSPTLWSNSASRPSNEGSSGFSDVRLQRRAASGVVFTQCREHRLSPHCGISPYPEFAPASSSSPQVEGRQEQPEPLLTRSPQKKRRFLFRLPARSCIFGTLLQDRNVATRSAHRSRTGGRIQNRNRFSCRIVLPDPDRR